MIDFGALRRIGRDIRKNFVPVLDIKLREREIHLLSLVFKEPMKPFVFYGKRLGLERSSFTYLSETLELKGLLQRVESKEDKRKKYLLLTEEGKRIVELIEEQFQEYVRKTLSVLSQEEEAVLSSSVETVKEIMNTVEERNEKRLED